MKRKYIYLPLEIVVREHDGKATLAHEAVSRGYTVVMGPKLALYRINDKLPEGLFLVKSAVPSELAQIRDLRSAGHKVCSLDEEGVVTYRKFLENNVRYCTETIEELDGIFFWGGEQREVFCDVYPEFEKRAVVTGNPRLDFWQFYARDSYAEEVARIRERYGRYMMFPSSFGIANNFLGKDEGVRLSKGLYGGGGDDVAKFLEGQADQNLVVYKEYLDFVPEICRRFPDMNLVVRPHPSESDDLWRALSAKISNLHLAYDGSVTPWILGSEAVLHFKSTTSIEAHLMGVPVVTYMPPLPEYMAQFRLELPLAVSRVASSRAEFLSLIEELTGPDSAQELSRDNSVFDRWVSIKSESSSSRVMDEIEPIIPEAKRDLGRFSEKLRKRVRRGLEWILIQMNSLPVMGRILPMKLRRNPRSYLYGKRKYLGFDSRHTAAVIDAINRSKSCSTRIQVSEISEGLVMLFPREGGE